MEPEVAQEWISLGERLAALCPDKLRQVMRSLREVVEAQEIISRFDWQLWMRGRPRKKYLA